MTTAALILAAGEGRRLGERVPKAFVPVHGKTLLAHVLSVVAASRTCDLAVIVVPAERDASPWRRAATEDAGSTGWPVDAVTVITGGETRQESARLGVEALPSGVERALCHDAARPCASPALFRTVAERLAVGDADGVVPVLRSPDAVKLVDGDRVTSTLPREHVRLVQTPQAFLMEALRRAHSAAVGGDAPDDSAVLEAAGLRVVVVEGEQRNVKVTTREDLEMAEMQLRFPSHAEAT